MMPSPIHAPAPRPAAIPAIPQLLARRAIRVDHVAVAVRCIETSIEWCASLFGFELVERRTTKGERTSMLSAVLKLGTVTIVLTQGNTPECQVSRYIEHYGPGVTHVAVEVVELPSIVDELKASGVRFVTEIIRSDSLLQAFTKRDPNTGLMFELIERIGGGGDQPGRDFSDESVNNLYRTLEATGDY